MGTADEQRGGGWGSQGECQRSAGKKPSWWDDGTDVESKEGRKRETNGGGRLFSFTVSLLPSTVLCHCNTPPLLRLFKSFHNNNINNNNINNNNYNNNDHDNAKKIYKPQPCLTTLSPQKGGRPGPQVHLSQ